MSSRFAWVLIGIVLVGAGCTEDEPPVQQDLLIVEAYPKAISASCRDGIAQIYDECSDQNTILQDVLNAAAASGKTPLIVYGAEWCIWCHVFDKYVRGHSRRFKYEYEYEGRQEYWPMRERENESAEIEAEELNKYVSENFVLGYIEDYFSPNGAEVLAHTGYDISTLTFVPLFVVLDDDGKYLGHMKSMDMIEGLEIRADSGREYRGYDRKILLQELRRLREASIEARSAAASGQR